MVSHDPDAMVMGTDRWLGDRDTLADPLLAQSALDRLQSSAYELVVEGESYRRRQKPTITKTRRAR